MKYKICLALLPLVMTSCASALKKQCESTNWFEHGKSVALSGRRLNSDDFVASCIKEKVNVDEAQVDLGFKSGMEQYCTPSGAVETGRKGDPFNLELCNPSLASDLVKEHAKGINLYCAPTNAYQQGALGNVYKNVCPQSLEVAFLAQFNKGRTQYLLNKIDMKTLELQQANSEISSSFNKQSKLQNQLQNMQLIYGLSGSASAEQQSSREDQIQSLRNQISQEEYSRTRLSNKVTEITQELNRLRIELGALK